MMKKKIIVIIPAYNEECTIQEVVSGTLKIPGVARCAVINDGSTDHTAEVARKSGAHVLQNKRNLGAGASVAIGLDYATKEKAEIVVLMDADGQHEPKYIPQLLQKAHSADLVIGSRYISPTITSTSPVRQAGTKVIACLLWLCYRVRLYDTTSGFRVINKRTIGYLAKEYPKVFPEPEVILRLIYRGYSIQETSVEMKPRKFGQSSIKPIKALYLMVYIVGKIVWSRLNRLV